MVSIEKEGYASFQRTWSGAIAGGSEGPINFAPIRIDVKLNRTSDTPAGMVYVPGGAYRLAAWRRPTDAKVQVDEFFIDRCEVTNRQYQEFVDAGGYLEKRHWTLPSVDNGGTFGWDAAMEKLTGRTGQPGPRGWSQGTNPEGKSDHPVTGVSWYEAAAYAAFRGKSLPTVFQWEMPARKGANNNPLGVTMPWRLLLGSTKGRANFNSKGTISVESLEFGMSPFGCFDMVGNVAEWCLNETSKGFLAAGGSWGDRGYQFGYYGTLPGFLSSDLYDRVGLRCVLNLSGASEPGPTWINLDDEVPQYVPLAEDKVLASCERYHYDADAPLATRVVEVVETDHWRREKISFDGADGERAIAYLYLPPKQFAGPHQVIHFVPAGDVWLRHRSLTQAIETDYGALIRSGRALFAVVLKGFIDRDRPAGWDPPSDEFAEYVDVIARDIVDMRRGLDDLEKRSGLDASRIAYLKPSAARYLLIPPAIDLRYAAVVLQGAGIRKWEARVHPDANPINIAPLIRAPKLLVHGLYDEAILLKMEAEPLVSLLPDNLDIVHYEGGHIPDSEFFARKVNAWLDRTLGPVTLNLSKK